MIDINSRRKKFSATSVEQLANARMIDFGIGFGICILVVTLVGYITGVFLDTVSPVIVTQNWSLGYNSNLPKSSTFSIWAWLNLLNYENFLSLLGIAWLAGLTILGYMFSLMPAYCKQKNVSLFSIILLEIFVLVVAASGILINRGF